MRDATYYLGNNARMEFAQAVSATDSHVNWQKLLHGVGAKYACSTRPAALHQRTRFVPLCASRSATQVSHHPLALVLLTQTAHLEASRSYSSGDQHPRRHFHRTHH